MLLGKSYFGPSSVMKMPAVPSIPLKGPYTTRDIPRLGVLMSIPLEMQMMLPPTHCGRAFWYVNAKHGAEKAAVLARAMYRAHWSDGINLSTPEEIAKVGVLCFPGLETEATMEAGIRSQAAKAAHAAGVEASIAAGVWGSPTFVVDGEIFWGVDRLWMVEEWLKQGAAQQAKGEKGSGWLSEDNDVPDLEFGEGMVVPTSVFPAATPKAKL